ncbi:hypothetical protein BHM03_00001879 [Ensete ventricosum]|nr:hypothetical protein BHM03_00001879 [Ensete ventricosum]
MVPKTMGASRHMHFVSEMHLTEELRGGSSVRASNLTSNESLGHQYMGAEFRGQVPMTLVVKGAEEVENAEANFKYQDKAKELHKTGVNELLIKITESGGLRVDARVLDQVTKYAIRGVVPFLLRGVGDKDDGEDGTIPEVTKTIKDLLQVGVKFFYFQAKLLLFRKFVAMRRQITVANSKQGVQTLRVLRKCEQRAGED